MFSETFLGRLNTDSYHLHVTALEIAMETSIGRWLGLKVGIATAITVVLDVVDGDLLFGIHDGSSKRWCDVKMGEWWGRSREGR